MPHIHEKIDMTVEVFVVHGDKVLMRKHDKYGIWLSVGGHIELDEDPNEAARREVMEEVGLKVALLAAQDYPSDSEERELIPPRFMNRHRINPQHEHVTLVYFANSHSAEVIQPEREKSDSIRWLSKEELESEELPIKPNIRHYALEALKALGKK